MHKYLQLVPQTDGLDVVFISHLRRAIEDRDYTSNVLTAADLARLSTPHVRLGNGVEGYGMCTGRDLELAMAIALLDAAMTSGIHDAQITGFVAAQADSQAQADQMLLRQVQATRIEMETF